MSTTPVSSAAAALAAAVWLAACATNPVTGEREFALMSEAQEIGIGQEMDPQVRQEFGVYDDPELQAYVQDIALRMARNSERPDLPWTFTVLDSPVVNAFALPGGFIYITRGIMAYLNDEAELAGVLGHEIGHVTARHAVQQYTRAMGANLGLTLGAIFVPSTRGAVGDLASTGLGLLFLRYGRDDELQSDRLGARYAATNGWAPGGVADMLLTLGRIGEMTDRSGVPTWLASHPEPLTRVDEIRPVVAELEASTPGDLAVDRNAYLQRITGLLFGDNPREGVVRGSRFLHRDLRFALDFPQGWLIQNSPEQVLSKDPGAEAYVLLQLVQNPQGRNLEAMAIDGMRDNGFQAVEGGMATIDGEPAFLGTFRGQLQQLGRVTARVAYIEHESRVFRLIGFAPDQVYGSVADRLTASLRSFDRLSPQEAASITPNRVAIREVASGDTWQALASRAGAGIVEASTLAIINGYAVNEQPRAGDRVKIVVAE